MLLKQMVSMVFLGAVMVGASALAEEGKTVDIAKLSCKELMAGGDSDRDIGFAFFHGYLAGKKNSSAVDLQKMSAWTDRARDFCLSNPTSTVMDAFAKSAN